MGAITINKGSKADPTPAELFPTLPEKLFVSASIAGVTGRFHADLVVRGKTGNAGWKGGIKRGLKLPAEKPFETLDSASFNYEGIVLKGGDSYTSKPKVRQDGSQYGGKNPTRLFTLSLAITDSEGEEHGYMLFVRLTYLGPSKLWNVGISFQRPGGEAGDPVVADFEGFEIDA